LIIRHRDVKCNYLHEFRNLSFFIFGFCSYAEDGIACDEFHMDTPWISKFLFLGISSARSPREIVLRWLVSDGLPCLFHDICGMFALMHPAMMHQFVH